MKPGNYTIMISGVSDDGEHMIQSVWYLRKETYDHFIKMLPEPHVSGMTPTAQLDRHGYEVMEKVGMIVLPQTFQNGGDQPTEQATGQ